MVVVEADSQPLGASCVPQAYPKLLKLGCREPGAWRRVPEKALLFPPILHPTPHTARNCPYSFHLPKMPTPKHLGLLLKLEF